MYNVLVLSKRRLNIAQESVKVKEVLLSFIAKCDVHGVFTWINKNKGDSKYLDICGFYVTFAKKQTSKQ